MRITVEMLLKLANDHVAQRVRSDGDIVAAYLHGSLLEEEPVLGGTADIDLFFIHLRNMEDQREIIRITDDIHFDITHSSRQVYRNTKALRVNTWQGPVIYGCKILYDPQHFMDFTQASVRGQFDRSDNVLQRARQPAEHARQIWLGFQHTAEDPSVAELALYLHAVDHAAASIASLNGPPLTERRFLLRYPERASAAGRPGLAAGLLGLIGAPHVTAEQMRGWLPGWRAAYTALPVEQAPARLHPDRLLYYYRAMEALLQDGQNFHAALWPMLRTWTSLVQLMPDQPAVSEPWYTACQELELLGAGFGDRLEALDAYLDTVEETLDAWAVRSGA